METYRAGVPLHVSLHELVGDCEESSDLVEVLLRPIGRTLDGTERANESRARGCVRGGARARAARGGRRQPRGLPPRLPACHAVSLYHHTYYVIQL